MNYSGQLNKLQYNLTDKLEYSLVLGGSLINLNALLGKSISLHFTGEIHCIHCDRAINKTFNQGYCFPCARSLARCDMCMVKPETCHYHLGTCREPSWGEAHCFIPHYIYIANTSGLKVGITRETNIPSRWVDQGAACALPIIKVLDRRSAGLVEVEIAKKIPDKTNWRNLLKGEPEYIDLIVEKDNIIKIILSNTHFDEKKIEYLDENKLVEISYPVLAYPEKVKSLNLDKTPKISGELLGIKGQYLILDTGVLSIRKFSGYCIEFGC